MVNCPGDALTPEEAASKRDSRDFDSRVRVTGFGLASALTTSTLSSRYDPRTVDESWVCVFCGQGSHHAAMGDLFGPYHVAAEVMASSTSAAGGSPTTPSHFRSPAKNSSQDLAMKFILGEQQDFMLRLGTKSISTTYSDFSTIAADFCF